MVDYHIDLFFPNVLIDRIQLNDKNAVPVSWKHCRKISFANYSSVGLNYVCNIATVSP